MRLVVMGLLAIAMGSACLAWAQRTAAKIRASAGWPTVQGVVTRARVERQETRQRGGGYTYHYDADVRYRYAVGGRTYDSDTFVFGVSHSFPDSAAAQAEVDRYPPGRPVRVFYDPRDPAEGCLVPGDAPETLALLAWMSAGLVLGGLALVGFGVRSQRAARRALPSGWQPLSP